jgi:hypothetical protein
MAEIKKQLNGKHNSDSEDEEDSLYSPEAATSHSQSPADIQCNSKEASNQEPEEEEPEITAAVVEQTDAEKEQEKKETELKLAHIRNNVDYGTILAFMDMFAPYLSIKPLPFNTFEASLLETRTFNRKLSDFHMNLIRNLNYGKQAKKDKLEHYLLKYMHRYALVDEEIDSNTHSYAQVDVDLKLKLVKNLLESQFDENQKLKQNLAEQVGDLNTLRSRPLGRDTNALTYWFYMDSEFSVRVYTQKSADMNASSWTLVAADHTELRQLTERLAGEPLLARLKNCKCLENAFEQKYPRIRVLCVLESFFFFSLFRKIVFF